MKSGLPSHQRVVVNPSPVIIRTLFQHCTKSKSGYPFCLGYGKTATPLKTNLLIHDNLVCGTLVAI